MCVIAGIGFHRRETGPDSRVLYRMKLTPRQIATYAGIGAAAVGVVLLIAGPFIGDSVSPDTVLTVEPVSYTGAIVLILGLAALAAIYFFTNRASKSQGTGDTNWRQLTQDYFDTFSHDMGRPFRRILGKEREVRVRLEESGVKVPEFVSSLMDEIEQQAPSFRLMLANVRVLVELEDPVAEEVLDPVDPAGIIRNIVDRYFRLAGEHGIELSWWAEPQEFGLVYGDAAALDHVVTNLVDNAVKFSSGNIEIRLTRNPTHYYIRVWDDGAGIPDSYLPHLFDRGWTPALAGRQEKTSSGLGLYITRTLCRRAGGDLHVESVTGTSAQSGAGGEHHTSFTVMLPLKERNPVAPTPRRVRERNQ
jgi:signal transduction histidine kinase